MTTLAAPFYDRWLSRLVNDPRDLVFVRLAMAASVLIPAAAGLYLWFSWWYAAVYILVWGLVFVDRVTLMLHCTVHRTLFRPEFRFLNRYIPWVLGPFFGQSPETYFAHHLGMHHVENNLPPDTSSTVRYRRDSFLHWLHYLGTFLFVGIVQLASYFWRKNNRKMVRRLLTGEISYWVVVAGLMVLHWQATLVVFLFPLVIMRVLMMAGNWGQHAFVDPAAPDDDYRNSITCINTRYNRRCFNDGYHIVHHVQPRKHYTEFPEEFEANRAQYGRKDAIVFDGLDFFQIWLLLMLGAWRTLARRFVRLPGAPARTEEEVIALLRSRVVPIRKD